MRKWKAARSYQAANIDERGFGRSADRLNQLKRGSGIVLKPTYLALPLGGVNTFPMGLTAPTLQGLSLHNKLGSFNMVTAPILYKKLTSKRPYSLPQH
jgi:hypothetical protein